MNTAEQITSLAARIDRHYSKYTGIIAFEEGVTASNLHVAQTNPYKPDQDRLMRMFQLSMLDKITTDELTELVRIRTEHENSDWSLWEVGYYKSRALATLIEEGIDVSCLADANIPAAEMTDSLAHAQLTEDANSTLAYP